MSRKTEHATERTDRPEGLADALVVGAGPAGAAAALLAARQSLRVHVIDAQSFPRERHCLGWLGPSAVEQCRTLGVDAKDVGATAFRGLLLYSWDLRKHVRVDETDLTGWIVDRARFDQRLIEAAQAAGATIQFGLRPRNVNLGEDRVRVELETGAALEARTLVIADGAASQTARLARLAPAGAAAVGGQALFATATAGELPAGLTVVIGAARASQLATLARVGGQVRISLYMEDEPAAAERAFDEFLRAAAAAKLIGAAPKTQALAPIGSGLALDVETHVGKRCLLIGDAGGFVSAFSREGIYPALKSGQIAAETLVRALRAPVLQDELRTFSSAWRAELADYLRMPNTDLSLLMPLVFGNAQMSARVARAFLLGAKF